MNNFLQRDFSAYGLVLEHCLRPMHRFCAFEGYHRFQEWFPCLNGKTVLVISPFSASIQHQMQRRHSLFNFPYPEFKLETVQTPITYAVVGNFPDRNLLQTSDRLASQMDTKEFDVAFLGCAAYTTPLVAALQKRKKTHIVLGGMLGMYFGVYGRRYDTSFFHAMMNDNWIRPLPCDRPQVKKELFTEGPTEALGAYF